MVAIFNIQYMLVSKKWPWNILIFISCSSTLKPRECALMRMTKNYFLFFSGDVFCVGKADSLFFITVKNCCIVFFCEPYQQTAFPRYDCIPKVFSHPCQFLWQYPRVYILHLWKKNERKNISTVQYQVIEYFYIVYVQTVTNIKGKNGIYGPTIFFLIT